LKCVVCCETDHDETDGDGMRMTAISPNSEYQVYGYVYRQSCHVGNI
jgi:hypothetical protein